MDIAKLTEIAIFVYGLLALIVKVVPTIPAKYPWLVNIMQFLGKLTNDQTDNSAVRESQK